MSPFGLFIFFLIGIPGLLVIINFVYYLFNQKNLYFRSVYRSLEIIILIFLTTFYIGFLDYNIPNDCCSDTAIFSPEHRLTIYSLIFLCLICYFYSSYRKKIAPPVIEVIVNCFLIIAVMLTIVTGIQVSIWFIWICGYLPVIMMFLLMLVKNHNLLLEHFQKYDSNQFNTVNKIFWTILTYHQFKKYIILFILCIPVLLILMLLLILFGQQPDSIIRAYTDTYKQGLSQLDCSNVNCPDGHYLCTIAASGHQKIVKPIRVGYRAGNMIKVNRQLLVSNAFEEIIQKHLPFFHNPIRNSYNKIGVFLSKPHKLLKYKFVSDIIYYLMKPLEWFFVLFIYTFDKNPENRIANQYL